MGPSSHFGSQTPSGGNKLARCFWIRCTPLARGERTVHYLSLLNIVVVPSPIYGDPCDAPRAMPAARCLGACQTNALAIFRFFKCRTGRGNVAEAGHIQPKCCCVAQIGRGSRAVGSSGHSGLFRSAEIRRPQAIRYEFVTTADANHRACLCRPLVALRRCAYEIIRLTLPLDQRGRYKVMIKETGPYTSLYSLVGLTVRRLMYLVLVSRSHRRAGRADCFGGAAAPSIFSRSAVFEGLFSPLCRSNGNLLTFAFSKRWYRPRTI